MVERHTRTLVTALALVLSGSAASCGGEDLVPITLDLCLAQDITTEERTQITASTVSWGVRIWTVVSGDFEEVNFLGTGSSPDLLSAEEAVPRETDVRVFARGRTGGGGETVAVAMSSPRQFRGGENLCLCVAPPERFTELCGVGDCTPLTTGSCQ